MPTGAKWYDNTLQKKGIEPEDVIKFFEEQTDIDRWCFEPEKGEDTGYEHYQVRYVLKKKSTRSAEIVRWRDAFGGDHNHVTVLGMQHPNWDYVQKEGTCTASWNYKSPLQKYKKLNLKYWEGQLIAELEDQNDRCITVVVDEAGGRGKTTFSKYLEANRILDYCPENSGNSADYVAYCCKFHQIGGYVFDIPRADTLRDKKQMWKAVEQIKNGCLYDRRYSPEKVWIDPPKILIFANEYPDIRVLSRDRWRVYRFGPLLNMLDDFELMRVDEQELIEIAKREEEILAHK